MIHKMTFSPPKVKLEKLENLSSFRSGREAYPKRKEERQKYLNQLKNDLSGKMWSIIRKSNEHSLDINFIG